MSAYSSELNQFDILARIGQGETLSPHEHAYLTSVLLERELTKQQERPYASETKQEILFGGGTTDATTGNLMVELYQVPAGWEAYVLYVMIDNTSSSTIIPSATFANSASWSFLVNLPKGDRGLIKNANASTVQVRKGMVAFAPTSAGGPIVPGLWTFSENEAPVLRDEQSLSFSLVGGSVAAITSQSLLIQTRIVRKKRAVS
jgi:hypothetical protein